MQKVDINLSESKKNSEKSAQYEVPGMYDKEV